MVENLSVDLDRREQSIAVCFASDEAFFCFTKGLVLSLREKLTPEHVLCFIDIGVSAASLKWLSDHNVKIFSFDPVSVIPAFKSLGHPSYVASMICRPLLPRIIPGFGVYVWLDCDTWVQEAQSIASFVAAARTPRRQIAISSTDAWAYGFSEKVKSQFQQYNEQWYSAILGQAVAQTYRSKKILNSGFFALAARSDVWHRWEGMVLQAYSKPFSSVYDVHMAEQTALNYICYAFNCFIQFSSFHNFNCHLAQVERTSGRVRKKGDDLHKIGIVHMTMSGRHGAEYLENGILYETGNYLTETERQLVRGLKHLR